jgi:hypothetical protein
LLKNSIENLISLSYTYLKAAIFEVSYSHTQNAIAEVIDESETGILLKKINFDNSTYYRFLLSFPIPILNQQKVKWGGHSTIAFQRQFDKAIIKLTPYNQSFSAFYLQHSEQVSFSSKWYADISATYYSSLYYGITKMDKQWWIDASVSKIIGSFKIMVQANDLFNTNKLKGERIISTSSLSFVKNWNYPSINLTLTYNFGKRDISPYKNRENLLKGINRVSTSPEQGISKP